MRVISGSCRGRKLIEIQGRQVRPTSDRVREAIFNILGQKVKNARVLDLFAGTGAQGIEALSRGAIHTTFIDLACDIIHENLKLCRFEKKAMVICHDIVKDAIPQSLNGERFDLVFIDPPYGKGYIEVTLQKESFTDLLAKDCIIIAEQSCKESLQIKINTLDIYRQKKYSKTIISFMNKI
ncbi:MAG: 16S rRNA (guanine(966)-N(2))-methyltransferase RsmD [Desulfobacula sp.]|uniref:16S rRNA (guanine(966)-N(2))-methyltransferase RsmD n=1 Tax=Desulfobacula sp. TaxID=2593537 RepID=UPI0025BE3293|nr:16S rRNA (guanine(966)-N(2))-methyltransferase RsmD [Desulfobacula sp.]MCD4719355.1 16S rRNA (guanine(966)-N(2))-methyltransferase RsmD [Desulfobacula sp.]